VVAPWPVTSMNGVVDRFAIIRAFMWLTVLSCPDLSAPILV
jgi:hypothetical protein